MRFFYLRKKLIKVFGEVLTKQKKKTPLIIEDLTPPCGFCENNAQIGTEHEYQPEEKN